MIYPGEPIELLQVCAPCRNADIQEASGVYAFFDVDDRVADFTTS